MIRILSKKEINEALPQQQVMERTQGVILTRRVEDLRQTILKDEINLRKFHDKSVTFVKEDIKEYLEIRLELKKDIVKLTEKRARLKEPLTKEWAKIDEENKRIESTLSDIDFKIIGIVSRENKLYEDQKGLKVEEERLNDEREELERWAKKTIKNKVDLEKLLKDSELKAENSDLLISKRLEEISKRESESVLKETNLNLKNNSLNQKEIELNNKERKLNDRYETLRRTLTRNKNGNNNIINQ